MHPALQIAIALALFSLLQPSALSLRRQQLGARNQTWLAFAKQRNVVALAAASLLAAGIAIALPQSAEPAFLIWLRGGIVALVLISYLPTRNLPYEKLPPPALEKILLAMLGIGFAARPEFGGLFLIAFHWHARRCSAKAFGAHSLTPVIPLLDAALMLFCIGAVGSFVELDDSAAMLAPIIPYAAHYAFSAWAKLTKGNIAGNYICNNPLGNFVLSSHERGWEFPFLIRFGHWLNRRRALANATIALVEIAGPLAFLWPSAWPFVFAFHFLLHVAIFACSGLCFWKLMGFNALLLALYAATDGRLFEADWITASACVVATLFAKLWLRPLALGWFDSGITHACRFFAETSDGETVALGNRFWYPYDIQAAQARFDFFIGRRNRANTIGTIERGKSTVFERMDFAKDVTPASLPDIIGYRDLLPGEQSKLDAFKAELRQRIADLERGAKLAWLERLQTYHIFSYIGQRRELPRSARIDAAFVECSDTFWHRGDRHCLRREIISLYKRAPSQARDARGLESPVATNGLKR